MISVKRRDRDNPPYVDAHVHLANAKGIEDARTAGVSALRDGGTREGAGILPWNARSGVTVLSAGWALFRKGGYGSRFGRAVETQDDMRREIRGLAEAGAGIIKVMASGMVSLERPGKITPGGFSGEELRIVVDEARGKGLCVMAHANGEDAIRAAISAGVLSVEHGFFMTEVLLEQMAENGVFWVPTVGALARAAEAWAGPHAHIDDLIRSHMAMIARAYERGVPLALGTDCVLPDHRYGERYRAELRYFEEAGIPREAAELIARDGGRKLLGLL